jgi:hypothetical protein
MRVLFCCVAAVLGAGGTAVGNAETVWPSVSTEEWQLKSVPEVPGAAAVYLIQKYDRNDLEHFDAIYVRLKVLTDEGREYGNIEVPYVKGLEWLRDLEARTIRADGSIVPFDGKTYDKEIVSTRGVKLLARTLSLSGIEPGCIIEYRFRRYDNGDEAIAHWILSQKLFVREGHYSLVPYPYLSLRWSWPNGLPPGSPPAPHKEKGLISLDTHNVPALVSEDHMPPKDEVGYRVDFSYIYDSHPEKDADVFWKTYGKSSYEYVQKFIDRRKVLEEALGQIVAAQDTPEVKLHKIYARMQRMRNYTYEPEKSPQEKEHERQHEADNVADVWKANAGTRQDITLLFLGLVRTAGLPASPLRASSRDEYFFNPRIMNPAPLRQTVVEVPLNGAVLYFAPGVPNTPYGLLPWWETDSGALRLEPDGGTLVATPLPDADVSHIEREAQLSLVGDDLQGTLTVRFTGLDAQWRRLSERNEDAASRRKFLEEQVAQFIPVSSEVHLKNDPDWGGADEPLVAQFDLHVSGWATSTGRRVLLPVGLFGATERHTFEHEQRVHPIYFDYPSRSLDRLEVVLPEGWHAASLPEARALDMKGVVFKSTAEANGQTLRLTRDVTRNLYYAPLKYYPPLQRFYKTVRASDEEQVVLETATPARAH